MIVFSILFEQEIIHCSWKVHFKVTSMDDFGQYVPASEEIVKEYKT